MLNHNLLSFSKKYSHIWFFKYPKWHVLSCSRESDPPPPPSPPASYYLSQENTFQHYILILINKICDPKNTFMTDNLTDNSTRSLAKRFPYLLLCIIWYNVTVIGYGSYYRRSASHKRACGSSAMPALEVHLFYSCIQSHTRAVGLWSFCSSFQPLRAICCISVRRRALDS